MFSWLPGNPVCRAAEVTGMAVPEGAARHGRSWGLASAVVVMAVAVSAWGAVASAPVSAAADSAILHQDGGASMGGNSPEPQVCDGCLPPLACTGGGSVLTEAGGLTVTPIYWEPSGGQYTFPAGYEDIINGYVSNVAAASGSSDNVYSVDTEYSQTLNGTNTAITYNVKAGTPNYTQTEFSNRAVL
jgi:hypothetical protein